MQMNRLILPSAIVVGALIIGGFFYGVQVNKQQSIERQQKIELDEKNKQAELDKASKKEKDIFDRKLQCDGLLSKLKDRWNNVAGIYYDEFQNTCIVKYWDKGKIQESALEDMQDTK